jgi:hypothetical protein
MSADRKPEKLSLDEFAAGCRDGLIPLNHQVSYFSLLPLSESELKEYLGEPVAALPPGVAALLPKLGVLFVPYIEKANGKNGQLVCFEEPPERLQTRWAQLIYPSEAILIFGIKDLDASEYHYSFYGSLARLIVDRVDDQVLARFIGQLRNEFGQNVHGEVDEESWQLKQGLMHRHRVPRTDTRAFREYARQSLADTLTLYLHGICCDIDVEPGPRQLPARHLKKRLLVLRECFPPPAGLAVFPEELSR